MSLRTMILRGRRRCRIERESVTADTGPKLDKAWVNYRSGVPILLNALSEKEAALVYEKFQVMAGYKAFILYVAGLREAGYRIVVGSRIFTILKVDDWDELGLYMRLYLQEFK